MTANLSEQHLNQVVLHCGPLKKHNIKDMLFHFHMTRDKYYVTCIIRQQELQGDKYSYIKLITHRHITIKLTVRICTIQESFTYVHRLGVNKLNMSFE